MNTIRLSIFLLIALLTCSSITRAESGVESLSPELRSLVSKEMIAIQKGMQSIIPAFVSGNMNEIANIAEQTKNSFILKQHLTDLQKEELSTKLPKSFIKMDKTFHEYAGMLEHVAKNKKTELVGFYFSKMIETCVACHTEFATHRFPQLDIPSDHHKHHH